ncbi:MAG: DMT family transporter [Myxococcota bacterium]
MELHRVSGRRGLGFSLAFLTMALWGALPIALQGVLRSVDPATITWVRFSVSAILLGAVLAARRQLPPLGRLGRPEWILLGLATVFLAANYLAYLIALDWTSPATAQVMIQLAPLLLALGGVVIFRERFTRIQWLGVGTLVFGLALFFAGQLAALVAEVDRYLAGNAVMVLAAATWAVYGLAQKQLLRSLASQGIMLCIYIGCTGLFAVLAEPRHLLALDATGWWLLGFCALNTIVAYGAFSEALQHWEASRVSAVLALTPLATLGLSSLVASHWPGFLSPPLLSWSALAGALLVVVGSLATALGAGVPARVSSSESAGLGAGRERG